MNRPACLRPWALLALFGALSLGAAPPGVAQVRSEPSWVLYGLGEQALEEGRYDEALVLLREAIRRRGLFPEAEAALGRALGAGGDLTLRGRQLEKALAQREFLEIPDREYELLYELADWAGRRTDLNPVQRRQAQIGVYNRLVAQDSAFAQARNGGTLQAYNLALLEERGAPLGLDRVFFLYRQPQTYSFQAHVELAQVYQEGRAWNLALNHTLFALIQSFTTVVEEYKVFVPAYEFRTLAGFFSDTNGLLQPFRRHRPAWQHLRETDFAGLLGRLAAILTGLAAEVEARPNDPAFAYLRQDETPIPRLLRLRAEEIQGWSQRLNTFLEAQALY